MAVKLSALKVGDVLYQACPVGHRRRLRDMTMDIDELTIAQAEHLRTALEAKERAEADVRAKEKADADERARLIASLTFREEVTGFGHHLARIYEQENGTFYISIGGVKKTYEAPTLRAARRKAKDVMERLYSTPEPPPPMVGSQAELVRALDAIASWEATLIDDEPESRRIARNVLHKLGLSPKGYKHETKREWTRRRRAEMKARAS